MCNAVAGMLYRVLLGEILVKLFLSSCSQKKTNGAPNGFYGDIDWDRYVSKNAAL